MGSWDEFEQRQPGLATAGRALFYQFGVGLAFLATVRRDGGPRVHPMCPLIHGGGLFAFIVPGPKQADLRRDGRYALHSFPCPDNDEHRVRDRPGRRRAREVPARRATDRTAGMLYPAHQPVGRSRQRLARARTAQPPPHLMIT